MADPNLLCVAVTKEGVYPRINRYLLPGLQVSEIENLRVAMNLAFGPLLFHLRNRDNR